MKIENSFTIDAPVEDAWALLTNIPEIAPCLPGAKLTGEEDGVYTGAVKIKVGPVTAEYRGTAEFIERDDVNHKATIDGKGRDSRGAGNAQALITAEMREVGGQTQVDISTDLKITGKVAQFGRGVMQDVSEKLLGQFAECLASKLEGTSALEGIAAESAAADAIIGAEGAATGVAEKASDLGSGAAAAASGAVDNATGALGDAASGITDKLGAAGKLGDVGGAAAGKAGAVAAGAGAAVAGAGALAAGKLGGVGSDDDDDALDLLDVAGGAVFKRLIPVALVLLLIIVILIIVL